LRRGPGLVRSEPSRPTGRHPVRSGCLRPSLAFALPTVEFPEKLPISASVREIALAVDANPVVIVAGETGSGKTTQLPKVCLAMGRGREGRIGVTQPRRIAATSVAARVASELGVQLGNEVGYQIRFSNRTTKQTYVKFMTDGILLAELAGDPLLRAYDTIILDEAHERSLNVDFLLGYLARILPQRPDLRVIVSSATLEVERFAKFFGDAPIIRVSGRTFPVEVIHRPPTRDEEGDLAETIANTIEEITAIDPRGDVLVFLPGEREIKDAMDALLQHALPHTVILPLYGRLSQADQSRVFQPARERRIVLATNVAETSLTIEGIVYVVDSGLARVNRYDPRTGVTRLLIEPISKASADQRKGRAGRTRSGVCFRLWEAAEHATRPDYTDPELLRVGLAMVVLRMKGLGLGRIEDFAFLDPPSKRAIDEGYRVLEELGAIDDAGELTQVGRELARLPVDPRIGRMIVAGAAEGAMKEVLIVAAALGLQDPRERPLAAQQKADMLHKRFRDESSDFASLVTLFRHYRETIATKPRRAQERACRDQLLSPLRMREWADVHRELASIASELGYAPKEVEASSEALHKSILPGFLSRIAMYRPEARNYAGARQTRFVLHPSSGLARKTPPWIVAAELVETSQLFGRTAAKIDPEWLEVAGGKLCKASYGDPFWSEKSGEAMIREQITLYGLPIVKDRPVRLAPIDRAAARRMFIVHVLVRGELARASPPAFAVHNQRVLDEVKSLRDRARRGEVLADEDAVAAFFERRIPEDVTGSKAFETWRRAAEAENPDVLKLSRSDVLGAETGDLGPPRFPDVWAHAGLALPLTYRFDPSEDDDGATIRVPLGALHAIDEAALEWTIPGWRAEKIALLLHGLSRAHKKGLGSIGELAETLSTSLDPASGSFARALSDGIFTLTGVEVPTTAWDFTSLPPHLTFHLAVVDGNKVIATSRELAGLRQRLGARASEAWDAAARAACPSGPRDAFGEALPETVKVDLGVTEARGYPALVAAEQGVRREVFASKAAADRATRGGLRKLLLAKLGGSSDKWEGQVPVTVAMSSLADNGAAPRKQVVARALDEAFDLDDPAAFPRTAAAFEDRFQRGRGRIASAVTELSRLAVGIATELDAVRATMKKIAQQPGAPRAALDDVRSQLAYLVPSDVLARTSRERLADLPRYLRAIGLRLARLANGPQKDAQKGAALAPIWRAWMERRDALTARGGVDPQLEAFRWLIEEYRVAVFAPELKPAVPGLSAERLAEGWQRVATS
jgi:ATP-dependent helicase HrpA